MAVNQPLLDALAKVFEAHVALPRIERFCAPEKPTFPIEPVIHDNTMFCLSGLKESVKHKGDIVILGEVASGVKINAGGNVTVARIEKGNLILGAVDNRVTIKAGGEIFVHGAGERSNLQGRSIFAYPEKLGALPAPMNHYMINEFTHQSRLGGFGDKVKATASEHIRISAEGDKCKTNGRWVVTGYNKPNEAVKLAPTPTAF